MFNSNKKIIKLLEDIRERQIKFDVIVLRHLNIIPVKMEILMSASLVLTSTASVLATPVENNADGSVFAYDPTKIVWSVQDPSVVSFTPNSDGTAKFVPLKVGTTQVGVVDSATGLNAVDTITVTAPPTPGPTSMSISFGTPTP